MSDAPKSRNVYELISLVSGELAQTGIAKSRKNLQQGYAFRGIDEVFNTLAPLVAKYRLVILPRILARECVERVSKSGSAQFFVTVAAEFDFVSAEDGSTHTVRTYGEAQDSGDKATNKAMSAAYKYAAFQTFCIPTEGDNDADAHTPEPTAPTVATAPSQPPQAPPFFPSGYNDWLIDMEATATLGIEALRLAWDNSKPEHRKYLTSYENAKWEALKKKAALVKVSA